MRGVGIAAYILIVSTAVVNPSLNVVLKVSVEYLYSGTLKQACVNSVTSLQSLLC